MMVVMVKGGERRERENRGKKGKWKRRCGAENMAYGRVGHFVLFVIISRERECTTAAIERGLECGNWLVD
jgi:hypothetical protein